MPSRTAVPLRRRVLMWTAGRVPAVARALRGTPGAGTEVMRRRAGEQGLPLDIAVWSPPGHERAKTGFPVLFVFARHDGDWLPSTLARDLNAIVVSMPTDDDDVAVAGMRWVAAHAAGWNGTAERIGVLGDGPGADLALRVTAAARASGGPSALRLVLVSPSGDVPVVADETRRDRSMGAMPDTLVHSGSADPRLEHVVAGVASIRASGAKARLVRIPRADQGWLAYPAADPALARRSLDEIVAYLRRGLNEERAFGVGPA